MTDAWAVTPHDDGSVTGPQLIVSLQDVRAWLNYSNPNSASPDDPLLLRLLTSACEFVERRIGPVVPTTYTERFDGWGGEAIELRHVPVLSITSVTEYRSTGGPLVLSESTPSNMIDGYQLQKEAGSVIRVFQGGWPRTWFPGSRNIEITYVAGRNPIPSTIQEAVLMLVAHKWQQGHQPRALGFGGGLNADAFDSDDTGASAGQWIGVPNKVLEALASWRVPVIG